MKSPNTRLYVIMQNPIAIKLSAEYLAIKNAMELLAENESIVAPKDDSMLLTGKDIKSYLTMNSKNTKRFVLVETESTYEIVRMIDNTNNDAFYSKLNPQPVETTDNETKVRILIDKYLVKDYASMANIDTRLTSKMKNDRVITYSYLQRNTASVSSFKRTTLGATGTLRKIIEKLIKEGTLVVLMRADTLRNYDTGAECYKIK